METVSQARIELKRRFADFLDANFEFDSSSSSYGSRALDLLYNAQVPRSVRIKVQSHDLRAFDASLLGTLLENPTDGLPAFQDAVREYVKSRGDEFDASESDVQSADEKRKHLKLQLEKNEEEFAKFLQTFVQDVWALLMTVSLKPGQVRAGCGAGQAAYTSSVLQARADGDA